MPKDGPNPAAPRFKQNPRSANTDGSRGYINRKRSSIAWDDIPQDRIGLLVHAITNASAAVMFGRTSDRGALSITVLDGDERLREWPHSVEDFEEVYNWLVSRYGDSFVEPGA